MYAHRDIGRGIFPLLAACLPVTRLNQGWPAIAARGNRLIPVRYLKQARFLKRAPNKLESDGETGLCEATGD